MLWDWSNITHLELRIVRVTEFLFGIPPQQFRGLKTFIDACAGEATDYKSKSQLLCNLVKHTTAIEELKISCDTQKSDIISALARNCSHLRNLRLRSFGLHLRDWWTPLNFDQLKVIGSGCPRLMELEVDLALPNSPQRLAISSKSTTETATTPGSIIITHSTGRAENVKRNQDKCQDGALGKSVPQEIPSWYTTAYRMERIEGRGSACNLRNSGVKATAKEQGINITQADDEYMLWKLNRRKKEVAELRNQNRADPISALAGYRNLRRLTIFTRIDHFVAQEFKCWTYERTRGAVQDWLKRLVMTKQGAGFEWVVVHVISEVVNEDLNAKLETLTSTYT